MLQEPWQGLRRDDVEQGYLDAGQDEEGVGELLR